MSDEASGGAQVSEELAHERIETKRKTFFMDLKRNDRGLFVKVSERSGGRRSTIMIPYEYVDEFIAKVGVLRAAGPDPATVPSSELAESAAPSAAAEPAVAESEQPAESEPESASE